MKTCALNEIDAYARKAARGAGMRWGLAEEAGKSARWLAARGLPGVELLARLLSMNDGRDYSETAPVITAQTWQPAQQMLCPISVGAALSDRIDELMASDGVSVHKVSYPLLLIPFLGFGVPAAMAFEVRWPGLHAWVAAESLRLDTNGRAATGLELADEVVISPTSDAPGLVALPAGDGAVAVDDDAWRVLDLLAFRTYVPESDESRQRGAGAGNIDND